MSTQSIKNFVKEKYSQIARQSGKPTQSSCCGPSSCCGDNLEINMIGDEYQNLQGYQPDADLGLGCGVPTEYAGLQTGQHVLDLGSGAGNDCFVVRSIIGDTGEVTGLDFSEEMVMKARQNSQKLGLKNVRFLAGDIEEMPFEAHQFDVVISNCVLNLVPEKTRAFAEIKRVLKSGGHFCVSDVVIKGDLPENLREDAEMYTNCIAGALQMEEYLEIIRQTGFNNIKVHKQKRIELPEKTLKKYVPENERKDFTNEHKGIFSITVSASRH
ncbi:MAG: arsenite methyltransferase [Bacteroidales bacterium]